MDDVRKYINKRYPRWLDYSEYQCSRAGIDGEGVDVLNEVMCDLLQKPEKLLTSLFERKSKGYTELDYFVLRMIKLNATSLTSPYRYRYRQLPTNENVDYTTIDIEDVFNDDEEDTAGYILDKTRKVREILEELDLSDLALKVFNHRFFMGEPFTGWDGPESRKELYDIYSGVVELIKQHLKGGSLF